MYIEVEPSGSQFRQYIAFTAFPPNWLPCTHTHTHNSTYILAIPTQTNQNHMNSTHSNMTDYLMYIHSHIIIRYNDSSLPAHACVYACTCKCVCVCVCVCSSTLNIYCNRVLQVNNVFKHDIYVVHEIVFN